MNKQGKTLMADIKAEQTHAEVVDAQVPALERGRAVQQVPALEHLELTPAAEKLAESFEVDLAAPVDTLIARNDDDEGTMTSTGVRIGLRLLAIKAKCEPGTFEATVSGMKLGKTGRWRCMQMAAFYSAAGPERAKQLLGLGQTKTLALLAAAPEVQSQILESAEQLSDTLASTTREFNAKLKRLTEQNERLRHQVETAQLQAQAKVQSDRIVVPGIPHAIADIRREVAALYEKARVASQDLADLGQPLLDAATSSGSDAAAWVDPTALQVLVALRSLHAQLGSQIQSWCSYFHLEPDAEQPSAESRAFYRPEEAEMVQRHFNLLLTLHATDKVKRENRAHNERSRGRKRSDV